MTTIKGIYILKRNDNNSITFYLFMANIIVLLLINDSNTIIFLNSTIDFINFQSLRKSYLFGFQSVTDKW